MPTTPLPDTPAPELDLPLVGGGQLVLADASPEAFTAVIGYRGLHCPVCEKYLQRFDGLVDDYAERGVELVAVSMDDEERAERTAEEWKLDQLRVAYGMDEDAARAWGLWISTARSDGEPDRFSEPGLFLIRPDGGLYYAAVTSMPWGRPDPEEMLGRIDFATEKGYPSRGRA